MISCYPTVVLVFTHVYSICLIATLLQNQLTIHRLHHYFCLHPHLISYITQYDTSAYPECHLHLLHLHHYIYLSTDDNLYFFQYLLVAHPVLPDQSPHCKYLLPCRCRFFVHIPHLCFIKFVLFVVGGTLLTDRYQGK